MKLLSIDTTTDSCSAALSADGKMYEAFNIAPRQHTELILEMVHQVLSKGSLQLSGLDAIAVTQGPGAFTGVRVGMSIAQGLAFSADIPVVAVSTLQVMAQGAYREFGASKVCSGLDARMNEVYWGMYESENKVMRPLEDDKLCSANEISLPEGDGWIGVGSAWHAEFYPKARDIIPMAVVKMEKGEALRADEIEPVYLRDKVTR